MRRRLFVLLPRGFQCGLRFGKLFCGRRLLLAQFGQSGFGGGDLVLLIGQPVFCISQFRSLGLRGRKLLLRRLDLRAQFIPVLLGFGQRRVALGQLPLQRRRLCLGGGGPFLGCR